MAAFAVLPVQHRLAQFLQPRHHLAGMAGVHPVVQGRAGVEHLGVRLSSAGVLVGGVARDVIPLLGDVGVAVFLDPRGPSQHAVIAPHIGQGHLADHRAKQLRPLHKSHRGQQAAQAAAHDAQTCRAGDAALDQVFGHRDEIIKAALAMLALGRLVPARAELAAAAQIGQHINPALRQPAAPEDAAVAGLHRNLKAAIAVEQRGRAVLGQLTAWFDDEVGHDRAVLGTRLQLLHPVRAGIKELGQGLQKLALDAAHFAQLQPRRSEKVAAGQQVMVGILTGKRHHIQAAQIPRRQQRFLPLAFLIAPLHQLLARFIHAHTQDRAARRHMALQRAARRGAEQGVELALACGPVGARNGKQRTGHMGLAA